MKRLERTGRAPRSGAVARIAGLRLGRALVVALAAGLSGCSGCSRSPGPGATTRLEGGVAAPDDETPELRARLTEAWRARGPAYIPRTRHKEADGSPRYTNRLILESSPYLLQHAHNPVHWYPWGDEAFALARDTGRPVFLSIGYSTCHWCHVMEEESFEDEEIAATLNARYVAIKVDREERPDVDAVYMTAVQSLTGSGGWPMSVWLTPARQPFFAGTYFPPRDGGRGNRPGFLTVLREQAERLAQRPDAVVSEARRLAGEVQQSLASSPPGDPAGLAILDQAAALAARRYDAAWGGARGAPKFPSSFPIRMLLRQHHRTGDPTPLRQAVDTLRHMAAGGIHDHVGGGFHRYATDARWQVPHFEKMLYDNALLALAYVEGWQASGDADLAEVARETLDYVLREMTSPEGGFYSATDADSLTPAGRREEGWFFTWTPAELRAALGAERARVVEAYFAVTPGGNFEGRTILTTPRSRDEVAAALAIPRAQLDVALAEAIPLLRAARAQRPAPLCDDKVQASWNGLMISALARAALALREPRYERAAVTAADFALRWLRADGSLRHSRRAGRTSEDGFLDDRAFVAAGLLDLFELTADTRWLNEAITTMDGVDAAHADRVHGGYFLTPTGRPEPLARHKPDSDGALPSGNSVALLSELRLSELTGLDRFAGRAETTLRAFAAALEGQPGGLSEMMLGVDFRSAEPKEIAVVLPAGAPRDAAEPLLAVLRRSFLPNRVLVTAGEAELAGDLGKLVPWAAHKPARRGQPTAYVCRRGACNLPTSDPAVFAAQLQARR
jgi:hypothetical protein